MLPCMLWILYLIIYDTTLQIIRQTLLKYKVLFFFCFYVFVSGSSSDSLALVFKPCGQI